jgi:uncharacterized protein (DUF362 family)
VTTLAQSVIHLVRVPGAEPRGLEPHNRVLRCETVEAAVGDLCAATTSPGDFRNACVVVKPNVFMPHAPATTDPRVTAGVIAWLLAVGASEVVVAEEASISTHIGRGSSTDAALQHVGYDRLVESFDTPRVRLALLRSAGDRPATVTDGLVLRHVRYPTLLAEADRVVNVPILKFHLQTLLTNAVKNTWSAAEPVLRAANHCWGLAGALLDVHYLRPPDLTVVDALQPLTRDHSFGDPLDWRMAMAGTDSLALDALGAWMLGFDDPAAVETVRLGTRAGFGVGDLDALQTEGLRRGDLPRTAAPCVPQLPASFPPLDIDWQCGRKVGPGCVAYLTAGLRALAERAPERLGRCQILVGEAPPEPVELADRVLFVGACALQGQVMRNVQRRLYVEGRSDALTIIPACPPMALRTQIAQAMGLD